MKQMNDLYALSLSHHTLPRSLAPSLPRSLPSLPGWTFTLNE